MRGKLNGARGDEPAGLGGAIGSAELVAFERRSWMAERIGWAIVALCLIAGGAGLFGDGPLARRTATAPGLELRYDAFVRTGAPVSLKVVVAARGGTARAAIATSYLDSVRLEHVTPMPRSVAASRRWTVFEFAAAGAGAAVPVTFDLEPERPGILTGEIRSGNGAPLAFRQVVYF